MTGEWGTMTTRTIDLDHEQLLQLHGRRGTRVKVIYGGVWLTEEGEPNDVFATSGDEVLLHARRQALLEGLGSARIEVIEPAGGRLRALVRRAADAARRLVRTPAWSPEVPRGTLALLAAVVGIGIPALVAAGIALTAPVAVPLV